MEEKITLCGDNCIACPRYNAHSKEELRQSGRVMVPGGLERPPLYLMRKSDVMDVLLINNVHIIW